LMPIAGIRGYITAIKTRWSNEHWWMDDVSYYFLLSAVAVLIAIFFQHTHFYRVVWLPVVVGLIAGRLAVETRSRPKKSET